MLGELGFLRVHYERFEGGSIKKNGNVDNWQNLGPSKLIIWQIDYFMYVVS